MLAAETSYGKYTREPNFNDEMGPAVYLFFLFFFPFFFLIGGRKWLKSGKGKGERKALYQATSSFTHTVLIPCPLSGR